jgi:hypothetical protein
MKNEVIVIILVVILLFVSILFLGRIISPPPPPNNQTACPTECKFGCLTDNITCKPGSDPCANVICSDKCEDTTVLDTNGECNPENGICIYKKMVCIFGCENNSCRMAPACPVNCPYGCEPGTDVCRNPTCSPDCKYGCIPGTTQCNSEPPSSGVKNGDFEGGYMGWNVSGIAFGSAPTNAALVNAQKLYRNVPYSGYSGAYFASSFFPQMDKRAMGNLTSEPFFINKNYLEFLVVGDFSAQIYIDLIVNKTAVYHIEPDNSYPPFQRITWNVTQYRGQTGVISVVDASNKGSIEVDNFMLVDKPSLKAGEAYFDPYRNFSIVPPTNWLVMRGATKGQVFIYGAKEDNFTTQIIAISEDVNANETTETYFAKGKTGLSMLLQNYSAQYESNITIGGLNAKQLDYTYISFGINLKSRQIFFVNNSIGYKISATAAENSFSRYVNDFNASIQSFKP